MTDLNTLVADLTRLQAAATPAPWTWNPDDERTDGKRTGWRRFGGETALNECGEALHDDAALIVASRNALPHLLARLEKLEAVADYVRKSRYLVGADEVLARLDSGETQ